MKTQHGGLRVFANALATVFTIRPTTNYRAAFPRKPAAKRMDEAWIRTGLSMQAALEGAAGKYGIHR